MDSSGSREVGGQGREENAEAWSEEVGGRKVGLGFGGWVVRVVDMGGVQDWWEEAGLVEDEGVGGVGEGWVGVEGERGQWCRVGVVSVVLEEVGAIARGFGEIGSHELLDGWAGGWVEVPGQETDPSVGGHRVAKRGTAEGKGLVSPMGRAVVHEGGGEGGGDLFVGDEERTM